MRVAKLTVCGFTGAALVWWSQASAAATLDQVKQRDSVACGVSPGISGFSAPDQQGRWTGIDVELCRGIAAAVLGDPDKVIYRALTSTERFTVLQGGEVDLLSRNTTWTAARDNSLGLTFPGGVTFYDGEGFLVKKSLGVSSLSELDGATVCITSGSTHELNMQDYFGAHGMSYQPVTAETPDVLVSAFDGGRCDVLTSDASQLAGLRTHLADPEGAEILPERISKEPLAPMVRRGDEDWGKVVSWTLYAMLNAEELGVTSENVDQMRDQPPNPDIARLLGQDGNFGEQLGLSNDWAYNIVKLVGNYAEVYERTVGEQSPLGIPRGVNALWNAGGIQYAPPVR